MSLGTKEMKIRCPICNNSTYSFETIESHICYDHAQTDSMTKEYVKLIKKIREKIEFWENNHYAECEITKELKSLLENV